MAELTPYHIRPPNLMGDGDILRTLGLHKQHKPSPYLPIDRTPDEIKKIKHIYGSAKDDSEPLSHALEIVSTNIPFPAPLRLPHVGALQRQEAVRELYENSDLNAKLMELLRSQQIFDRPINGRQLRYAITIEKTRTYLDGIAALRTAGPQAASWKRAIEWAEATREDTLVRELYRQKRSAKDSRLFTVYSERYGEVRIGMLRPDVKPEEVFDFLDDRITEREEVRKTRRGKTVREVKRIINFDKIEDEEALGMIVGRAKQRFDHLSEITASNLLHPLLITHAQLQQLYGASELTKRFEKEGDIAFPAFGEAIDLQGIRPVRMLLNNLTRPRETLHPTTIELERLVNIEGANWKGKTETLRTLFLSQKLANMGAALPATSATLPAYTDVTFFHGNRGPNRGGSEYQAVTRELLDMLQYVRSGELVLIDEFGDATNAPTACETAQRLLPELLKKGCTVVSTTQHGAISDVVRQLGGANFTPRNYQLARSEGPVDYRPEETLDSMGFTVESIRRALERQQEREPVAEDEDQWNDVDLPF